MSKKTSKPHAAPTRARPDEPAPSHDAQDVSLLLKTLFLTLGELDEAFTDAVLAELSPAEQHVILAMRAAFCTYHELKSAEAPADDATS